MQLVRPLLFDLYIHVEVFILVFDILHHTPLPLTRTAANNIMANNVDKMRENLAAVKEVELKTDEMVSQAQSFAAMAKKLKAEQAAKSWWEF
jgi:hypothetical protein